MPDQATTAVTLKTQLRDLALFAGAGGGFGGLLSWVYTLVLNKPVAIPSALAVFGYVVLGIGSALFGLFLLAHTDTRAVKRAFAFAVVCGFAWRPIYDASIALVHKETAEYEVRNLAVAVKEDSARLSTGRDPSADDIETTSKAAAALLSASSKIRDPALREDASRQAELAVAAIRQHGTDNPHLASALLRVARSALESDSPGVAGMSLEALRETPAALANADEQDWDNLESILVDASATDVPRLVESAKSLESVAIAELPKVPRDLASPAPNRLRDARRSVAGKGDREVVASPPVRFGRVDGLAKSNRQ